MSPRVRDASGNDLEIPSSPRRIVSLVPSLSEALWWFHAADSLVGVTDWCTAPPHGFPFAQRIRGTKNPDLERIIALRPELVVANLEENRAVDIQALRDEDIPVYVTAPATVAEASTMLVELATLVGVPGMGEDLATSVRRAGAAAHARRPNTSLRAVVPVWRDPWMVLGAGTYATDLLALCGFEVVTGGVEGRYPHVDLERLGVDEPDVVLLPDEPYAFSEADRPDVRDVAPFVRRIDGTALTWYGPRMPYAIAELSALAGRVGRRVRAGRAT